MLTISIGTTFASTKIGDLYYNLNSSKKTAEVTYQEYYTSENYYDLTSVNIPSSVTYNNVTYSVTSIGDVAFHNCTNLMSVHITDIAAWCKIDFANEEDNPLYFAHNLYINGELATKLVII